MKPEDIKVGEMYYIQVSCDEISCGDVIVSMKASDTPKYGFILSHSNAIKLLSPIPAAPKYDTCRPFRVGDIVTPIERDGREVPDGAPVGEKCTVVESEKNGIVRIRYDAGSEHYIHEIPYFHLELVTPADELEPYRVVRPELYQCVRIMKEKRIHSSIPFDEEECVYRTLEEAKAAAEAECARLNAEYRKEQA